MAISDPTKATVPVVVTKLQRLRDMTPRLIRATLICVMLILVGTASLLIDTARSLEDRSLLLFKVQLFLELLNSVLPLRLLILYRG